MEKQMFCFQCEQTMGGTGCTGRAGVCGKSAPAAKLQDELTGALIGLARTATANAPTSKTNRIILEGLFTTITNVNFDVATIQLMIDKVNAEKMLFLQIVPPTMMLNKFGTTMKTSVL